MQSPTRDRILVLDFGSQTTMLIARRIREARVYCEIWPCTRSAADIAAFAPAGIVLSGGPCSVYEPDAPQLPAGLLALGVPILGICYGLQALTYALGGRVEPGSTREFGRAEIALTPGASPFGSFGESGRETVWMSHGDHVAAPAPGFEVVARSADGMIAALADDKNKRYGVQFHPEVVHTPRGEALIRAFVRERCGCAGDWTMASFVDSAVAAIRAQVGDERVLCGLSGGVDSSVAAALIHRAIGDRLQCVFVDNGLLRAGEAEEVVRIFGEGMGLPLHVVDAGERFLSALDGVSDPERKRKIIGERFIREFEDAALALGRRHAFLAQGTLYPDVIESVSFRGPSATIKSHHNVGGLPERMNMALCEPLRELFKDEVRVLGEELGLPANLVWRQPFPGPGLAVRVAGAISREGVALVRAADAVVRQELEATDLARGLWQYFAVLLPVRSVGVMGDSRTYEQTIAVRAVHSQDGMTADVADLPAALLGRIATRIINEVRGINRVVYDVTSKPPGTIEWE